MKPASPVMRTAVAMVLSAATHAALAQSQDPRLREVIYDPRAVIDVAVKRGVVTHILLAADEAISDVGTGLGADCTKPEAVWCIAAQAGGRNIFIKPKSGASAANNLAVVTDKRTHSFRLIVLPDGDAKPPVYRLAVRAPVVRTAVAAKPVAQEEPPVAATPAAVEPSPEAVIAARLQAGPEVVNSSYSLASGKDSEEIVPTLVFDDGRFTYFRFPGNREVPAVFHVLGDGSETLVNTRMEGDLLVVDRISRELMLRSGSAVVGVWNDDFDLDGRPPTRGATVPGIERVVKSDAPVRHLVHGSTGRAP